MSKLVRARAVPLAPPPIVRTWFEGCPGQTPVPSEDACNNLARGLQIAVNRQNNAQLAKWAGKELPILELKDVSAAEIITDRWFELRNAANHLAFALERLEDYVPRHEWVGSDAVLQDLDNALAAFGAHGARLPPPAQPSVGHPGAPWHYAAHFIAPLIQEALRTSGVHAGLSKTDPNGATAIVGAAAISWAYDIEIQEAGFAAAMKRRNRRKAGPKKAKLG